MHLRPQPLPPSLVPHAKPVAPAPTPAPAPAPPGPCPGRPLWGPQPPPQHAALLRHKLHESLAQREAKVLVRQVLNEVVERWWQRERAVRQR